MLESQFGFTEQKHHMRLHFKVSHLEVSYHCHGFSHKASERMFISLLGHGMLSFSRVITESFNESHLQIYWKWSILVSFPLSELSKYKSSLNSNWSYKAQ